MPAPTPDRLTAAEYDALMAGVADAVDAFFRAQHVVVYRLCLGFLADADEAEDAAQDGVLALLDRLGQFDPKRSFTAWRNTVVLNLCRCRRRSSARRRRAELAAASQRAEVPAPTRSMDAEELQAALAAALQHLPEREREVFVLRDLEGQETADVAMAMGVEDSTVRSLSTLARRRLRALLAERLDASYLPGGPRG